MKAQYDTVTIDSIMAAMALMPPVPDPLMLVVHPQSRADYPDFFRLLTEATNGALGTNLLPIGISPYAPIDLGWVCNLANGDVTTISLRMNPETILGFTEAVARARGRRSPIDGGGEGGQPE